MCSARGGGDGIGYAKRASGCRAAAVDFDLYLLNREDTAEAWPDSVAAVPSAAGRAEPVPPHSAQRDARALLPLVSAPPQRSASPTQRPNACSRAPAAPHPRRVAVIRSEIARIKMVKISVVRCPDGGLRWRSSSARPHGTDSRQERVGRPAAPTC